MLFFISIVIFLINMSVSRDIDCRFLVLRDCIDQLQICGLSSNPNSIEYLKQNPDQICYDELSANKNAMEILEKNIDKINWKAFSINPNGIKILKQHYDKIDLGAIM